MNMSETGHGLLTFKCSPTSSRVRIQNACRLLVRPAQLRPPLAPRLPIYSEGLAAPNFHRPPMAKRSPGVSIFTSVIVTCLPQASHRAATQFACA